MSVEMCADAAVGVCVGARAQIASGVEDDVAAGEVSADHENRTYLGFNPYNYLGRESEGNRFIGNTEL
jgi:hypothetical protein